MVDNDDIDLFLEWMTFFVGEGAVLAMMVQKLELIDCET